MGINNANGFIENRWTPRHMKRRAMICRMGFPMNDPGKLPKIASLRSRCSSRSTWRDLRNAQNPISRHWNPTIVRSSYTLILNNNILRCLEGRSDCLHNATRVRCVRFARGSVASRHIGLQSLGIVACRSSNCCIIDSTNEGLKEISRWWLARL